MSRNALHATSCDGNQIKILYDRVHSARVHTEVEAFATRAEVRQFREV